MRKKLLSLALALVMCLGLAVPAFAEETHTICEVVNSSYRLVLSEYVSKETANCKVHSSSPYPWELEAYTVNPGAVFTAPERGSLMMRRCTLENGEYIEDRSQDFIFVIEHDGDRSFTITEEHAGYWEMSFGASESNYDFLLHVTGESAAPEPEPVPEPTPEPAPQPAPVPSFTDVSPTSPYADAINWAVSYGITNGTSTTTFSPDQGCTNAQILTFLWRRNGEPEPTIANPFTNSIPEAYEKAAVWAYEMGMVSGATFDVDKPCTRAMTVTYLWIDNGRPECQLDASEGEILYTDSQLPARFTDVPASAPYRAAVAWAIDWGVTNGTSDTTFSPDQACTRGQIMTFIYRNTQ